MDDNGLIIFFVVFVVIIAASIGLSNYDQITPAVAEAQASMSFGATTTIFLEKVASIGLKLFAGAAAAGFGAAAFSEARKAYGAYKRNAQMGRWKTGPNAYWGKQSTAPTLKKEDLMLLALMGRYPADKLTNKPPSHARDEKPGDELDIEL